LKYVKHSLVYCTFLVDPTHNYMFTICAAFPSIFDKSDCKCDVIDSGTANKNNFVMDLYVYPRKAQTSPIAHFLRI